jgi:hypothetical protein
MAEFTARLQDFPSLSSRTVFKLLRTLAFAQFPVASNLHIQVPPAEALRFPQARFLK